MDHLPFNKLTLSFEKQEYEKPIKVFSDFSNFVRYSTIFMTYLVHHESLFAVVAIGLITVSVLIALLNSHKLEKQMSYIYCMLYILTMSISLFLANQYLRKSLYVIGYSTSSLSAIQSLFCHYGLRIPLFILAALLQLYILDAYNAEDFQFICLLLFSQLEFAIYAHYNEYMNRLSFSYMILNDKFKDIINQFVPQSLVIINLNQRTQQLELQFQNQQSQQCMNIEDTKTMINIFRQIIVVPKEQQGNEPDNQLNNLNRSLDQQRKGTIQQQTLEEFVFHKINKEIDKKYSLNNNEELNGILYSQPEKKKKSLSIRISDILYGKNMLLIIIKEIQEAQKTSEDQEKIKFLTKIIQYLGLQMQCSHQQIFKIFQVFEQLQLDQLQKIKCIFISLINKFENFTVFLNSHNLQKEFPTKQVYLKSYITNIVKHLRGMATYQHKQLLLQFDLENYVIRVNTKYLTQIIINIYEQALGFAPQHSKITLQISNELNLNPLDQHKCKCYKSSLSEINNQRDEEMSIVSLKIDKQHLIRFQFTFTTNEAVELESATKFTLNPLTLEEYINNNNSKFDIIHPITNSLLQKIGPYDQVQYSQTLCDSQHEQQSTFRISPPSDMSQSEITYQNTIIFYIYADQTQINQSFVKFIRQKSFLDL